MQRHAARTLTSIFHSCQMADGEDARGFYYDTSAGDNGPPAGGKRRLIREGGGGGATLGSGIMFGPGPRRGSSVDCFPTTDDN